MLDDMIVCSASAVSCECESASVIATYWIDLVVVDMIVTSIRSSVSIGAQLVLTKVSI